MALSERVLELERQGFIPMDEETEEQYLDRVEHLVSRMEELRELITQNPEELGQFFGGDLSQLTLYDTEESVRLLEDAYDFVPKNHLIFALDGPFDAWVRSSSIGQKLKIAGMRVVFKTRETVRTISERITKRPALKTYGYTGHDICIEYKDTLIPTAFIRRSGLFDYDEEIAAHETMHLIRHTIDDSIKLYDMLFPFNIGRFAKDKDVLLEECLAFYLSGAASKERDLEGYVERMTGGLSDNPKKIEGKLLGMSLHSYLHETEMMGMSAVCLLEGVLFWMMKPRTIGTITMGSWCMLQGTTEAAGLYDRKKSLPRIIDDMLTVEEELSGLYGRKAGQAITGRLKRNEMHELVTIILDSGDVSEYLANAEGLRWDIIRERYLQN